MIMARNPSSSKPSMLLPSVLAPESYPAALASRWTWVLTDQLCVSAATDLIVDKVWHLNQPSV